MGDFGVVFNLLLKFKKQLQNAFTFDGLQYTQQFAIAECLTPSNVGVYKNRTLSLNIIIKMLDYFQKIFPTTLVTSV